MKLINISLIFLFCILQYKLWLADGGVLELHHLEKQVKLQQIENNKLISRNEILTAEVIDLKNGLAAIEELIEGRFNEDE